MDASARLLKLPADLRKPESEALKGNLLQTGFIAQEVEQAAKELGFDFSGVDKPKNDGDYYGLRYAEFVVPLVKAMQEQQLIIETEKAKSQKLEAEVQSLRQNQKRMEDRLKAIEENLAK